MSQGNLRTDKTCLNCGHTVEERYCPHCGQENREVKQPFHYLFTHFFEDFTHYDSQFWKTISNLLFSPGTLTKTYLEGKRQEYVPPVKLYIFISFVTFFLISFVGTNVNDYRGQEGGHQNVVTDSTGGPAYGLRRALETPGLTHEDSVSIQKAIQVQENALERLGIDGESLTSKQNLSDVKIGGAETLEAYDALTASKGSFVRKLLRPFAKKAFEFKENKIPLQDILEEFYVIFMHTLPKALFFYLPVFALILWVFHNKKSWWYFDHGVFTLHYFSFLLINIAFFVILSFLTPLLGEYSAFNFISTWLYRIAVLYGVAYFFIAHRRFYGTRKRKSVAIGITVFMSNLIAFSIMLILLASISLLLVH